VPLDGFETVRLSLQAMNSHPPQETAARTYLHFLAYVLPSACFVIFATIILLPRLEVIWDQAGQRAAMAEWVIELCRAFLDYFYYVVGSIVGALVLLEKFWARWQTLRSSTIRCLTWVLTFSVMAGLTWIAVSACLAVPMASPKPGTAAQKSSY
jgi:hypothetical protein